MAPPAPLLPLLLALLGRADPGRACDLQPVTAEPPITLSYATSTVTRGCVSSGSLDTGREVHVLNIKWTKVPAVPLNVSVTPHAGGCVRPAVLIIFCSRCLATITSPCPDLLVRNDTHISLSTTTAPGSEPLVASEGELLAWAQSNYGGITSYSELRDPRWVQLRLGEDASSPQDCIPQEHFDAAPHLETEVFFHGVKSCSQEDAQNTRAAHIVRLQPEPRYRTVQVMGPPGSAGGTGGGIHLEMLGKGLGCLTGRAPPNHKEGYGICRHGMLMLERVVSWFHSSPITEVNLTLSCPEKAASNQIIILQSRANLTWSLYIYKCDMRFMVSGNYTIVSLPSTQIPGVPLPDTEQGLIAEAFEKNYSVIASYSIIPVSTRIILEIREHETVRSVPVIPTTSAPTHNHDTVPRMLLSMLKPWKCTDETLEIVIAKSYLAPIKDVVNITLRDISCQAEKNTTHFMLKAPLSHCGTLLEGRDHAKNELILSLARGAELRSVRVGFQCNIPRELFLRLFPTAAFEAPQTELEVNKEAFVQASMQWEDHPADLQLKECWLVAPGWEPVLLVQGGEARGAGVAVLEGPPSSHGRKVWRFRFTYSVPEGRHVPFSATLKCKAGLQNNTIFEKVLEVTVKDGWRSLNNRGLGLAAVLGITFGAFLIGALLTAGLWYIYSHTRPISKLQPVSSTAPASESSSTNHSIGSTQSTPCSTSSMA